MLKMLKKALIFSTLLSTFAMFAVGCNVSKINTYGLDKDNPVAVEIWYYYNGSQKIEFDKIVNEFNNTVGKEQGIIVEAFNQGNVNELTEKILDTANKKVGAGKMPDAFMAYPDTAYEIEKLGFLSEFSQYMTKSEVNEYLEPYINEGRLSDKEKLNIFPIAKSTEILMVNKTDFDIFSKETNADINDLETWEGIVKLSKEYYEWTDSKTQTENDGKAFFGRDAMANYMMLGSLQLGKEIFEVNDGKLKINIDDNIMRKLWDNFYIPYINGYYGAYGKFRTDDAKTGDIIALVGSTSGAEYFPDSVITNDEKKYPIEILMLKLPRFEGTDGYMTQQGAGIAMTKSDSKHEFAVTQFVKWFTDSERNAEFALKSGYLPVKKEANTNNFIEEKIEKNNNLDISIKSKNAILTAIKQRKTYNSYYNKAFYGGNKARSILEKAMIEKAKADREEIKKLLDRGISKEEVMKEYETDENFNNWLKDLKNNISNVV